MGFLVNPYVSVSPPTITSASGGNMTTGSSITINGTKFVEPLYVNFVGTGGTSVLVYPSSETAVSTTCPALTEGESYYLTVTTPGGTSNQSSTPIVWTAPPVITSVSPSSGAANATVAITVTGTGFTNLSSLVAYNNGSSSLTIVSITSDTSVSASVPAGRLTAGITYHLATSEGGVFTVSDVTYTVT